jgi:hypothetical protein
LWREYKQLAFHDGELIEDFAMRLTSLTNQLATLGDAMSDDKIISMYLCVARSRYQHFVISIETLFDIDDLFMKEITTRLKALKDDGGVTGGRDGEKLYLKDEEWLEHYKQKEPEGSRRGGGSDSHNKGRGGKNK